MTSPLDKAAGHEVAWRRVSDVFDAARQIRNCKFVYFIGEDDDGPVKIGVAKDPISRLRAMQTGNPRRLRVEHVLVGDMDVEKLLPRCRLDADVLCKRTGCPFNQPARQRETGRCLGTP
jgi:hypothetical protein